MNDPSRAMETDRLRQELAGQHLLRLRADGTEEKYQVCNEMDVAGQHYAILHKENDHPDEAYLFRIHQRQAMEIEDEAEWEKVAEAVDEWYFMNDQQ